MIYRPLEEGNRTFVQFSLTIDWTNVLLAVMS